MSTATSPSPGPIELTNPLEQRQANQQVEAMAAGAMPWVTSRLLTGMQVLAWVLAIGGCVLPVAVYQWVNAPVKPFVVTTSGFVAELEVVDPQVLEQMLQQKKVQ